MTDDAPGALSIKRYPNRRFYDATRSCHVTLAELYELVSAGRVIRVTDSVSGHDITNVVLTQMILDHDADKLAVFPSEVLHAVIRTRQQFLGGVFEDFFRRTVDAQRAAQEQWARLFKLANPSTGGGPPPASEPPARSEPPRGTDELAALRRQLADLTDQVERLSAQSPKAGRKRPPKK